MRVVISDLRPLARSGYRAEARQGTRDSPAIADRIREVDGIRAVAAFRQAYPEVDGSPAAVGAVDPRQLAQALDFPMVAGALTALKDNGIAVPQHLSLIGFDDIPIARYTDPQLTTVRYPIASMAKLATELALQGAAGLLDPGATHCFMPTLVRRHSVAARQIVVPITN